VSPVKYELCFYIPEDDILHSHRRENLKSYSFFNLHELTALCVFKNRRYNKYCVVRFRWDIAAEISHVARFRVVRLINLQFTLSCVISCSSLSLSFSPLPPIYFQLQEELC
jgi:hypothetical protein